MCNFAAVTLMPSLLPGAEDQGVRVLRAYFANLVGEGRGYTGGSWDTFDPAGTRGMSADTFTSDDLAACALLSTSIKGKATRELLDPKNGFGSLLHSIGPDRDFITLESTTGSEFAPVRALYVQLCRISGIGETRATKLLARKRPRLVPIVDSVVRKHIFSNGRKHWEPLHAALKANDNALWERLVELRDLAELPEDVSVLRVFDVLAWMDGSGNTVAESAPTLSATAQKVEGPPAWVVSHSV